MSQTSKVMVFGGFLLVAFSYIYSFMRTPSNEALLERALKSPDQLIRLRSAQALCERNKLALPEIREMAQKSDDEDTIALGLSAMSRNYYYDGVEDAFNLLESSSLAVRKSAAKAIATYLGVDHHFPVGGKESDRKKVSASMRDEWERYQKSKLFQINRERLAVGSK